MIVSKAANLSIWIVGRSHSHRADRNIGSMSSENSCKSLLQSLEQELKQFMDELDAMCAEMESRFVFVLDGSTHVKREWSVCIFDSDIMRGSKLAFFKDVYSADSEKMQICRFTGNTLPRRAESDGVMRPVFSAGLCISEAKKALEIYPVSMRQYKESRQQFETVEENNLGIGATRFSSNIATDSQIEMRRRRKMRTGLWDGTLKTEQHYEAALRQRSAT